MQRKPWPELAQGIKESRRKSADVSRGSLTDGESASARVWHCVRGHDRPRYVSLHRSAAVCRRGVFRRPPRLARRPAGTRAWWLAPHWPLLRSSQYFHTRVTREAKSVISGWNASSFFVVFSNSVPGEAKAVISEWNSYRISSASLIHYHLRHNARACI